jgi:ABC-type sugar transport system ATPase subunit
VALSGCTLSIPGGHVVGLVGRNGAGKTTLLNLAVGLTAPTTGTIEVLGGTPTAGPAQLGRIGFLAQDSPVYPGLSVADHLRLGAHLNPSLGCGAGAGPGRPPGPGSSPEGRHAVWRAAGHSALALAGVCFWRLARHRT